MSTREKSLNPSRAVAGANYVHPLVRRCDIGLVTRLVREIDHVATGALMRQGRQRAKISLREMARRLDYSAPFVSDLELGRRNWTEELEAKYAAVLCPPNTEVIH